MKKTVNVQDIVLVELDYKGTYERGIMSLAHFKKTFPCADVSDLSGQSETLRPMVHVWYAQPKNEGDIETFLTDMEDGLPEGDIADGNIAILNKDLFSKEYLWMIEARK